MWSHQNRWTANVLIQQPTQTVKMCAEIMLYDAIIPIQIDRLPVSFCGEQTILQVLYCYSICLFIDLFQHVDELLLKLVAILGETHVKMKGCFLDNACTNTECIDTSKKKKMNFCCCTGHMCNSEYKLIPTTTKPPKLPEESTYRMSEINRSMSCILV